MQVILTHEQADFDALASLLGAYLLQKDAYVVLPNALNRNVQSFLHLYGADLPFTHAEDLPNQPISVITLVDTQSLVTLKGMRKDSRVFVVDHHQKKEDLPEDWHFESVETIACTTHFVEILQEANGPLNLIHATLLLLGIYEDSGSLSYAHTTSRDASAVAYLLESGASLKIAANFLNPPLSLQQHKVFEELVRNMDTLTIQNCRILVAHADAPELEDEVSSIAHKLRDLLDPDALFIFVRTREGIRMVARSLTDQVDVAQIARQFSGGGHARASAALLKHNKDNPQQLIDILRLFKAELPSHVQPVITVSQIMSKKPLTICPDTTAKQANELMQRFGYEGYPVVKDNEIVGLLTRRAVDRALAHKLDLTAASLMDAGSVSVSPGDSLETLQRIMADSGWGQVPVIDPASREVIAIATRTDLLNILAGRSQENAGYKNLSQQINKVLPPAHLALLRLISQAAAEWQVPIYLVGGFVRDLLLRTLSLDLDFVVEGDAILLAEKLSDLYGGRITSHKKFGTAKWQLRPIHAKLRTQLSLADSDQLHSLPASIDLISARTEFYEKPSALPTVKKGSIKLDLHRRDFTINTMAVRLDGSHFGELVDYWGGMNDLKKGIIRVLHSLSFVDDPTRMLRAVRFEQRFGFIIEARTLELLREARGLLDGVSGERIRHELDLMLAEDQAARMLARLEELNLLRQIHPSLSWKAKLVSPIDQLLNNPLPVDWGIPGHPSESLQKLQAAYVLLLARLAPEEMESIALRLRLKNQSRSMLRQAQQMFPQLSGLANAVPSQIYARLEDCPPLLLYCLSLLCPRADCRRAIVQYATRYRLVKPQVDGRKLHAMGVPIGPRIGQLLDQLKAAWLDGRVRSPEEEAALLSELLR